MYAQTKYESEVKTAILGDRTIIIKNLTPVLPPKEREKRRREVEQRLFDVFSKYAGQRGYHHGGDVPGKPLILIGDDHE